MSLRVRSSGFVVLGVVLMIAATAVAQPPRRDPNNPRGKNPGQQNLQPIKVSGSFVSAGQNQIQVSTNTNQKILVMMVPNTQVSVTGKAELDYLKAGVGVEFVADIDKEHKVADKITHLLVVSLTGDRPAGLSAPELATTTKKSDKGDKAEGDKPKPVGHDPGVAEPKGKGKKGKTDDPLAGDPLAAKPAKSQGGKEQLPGTFTVRGTIKMCKSGQITVAAGRGPTIKAEVAGDVAIDVDMSDPSAIHVAQADDRVTVNGKTTQARPNLVLAESISIDLNNPLSGSKKHATHSGAASKAPPAAHPTTKPKKGSDADDLLGK